MRPIYRLTICNSRGRVLTVAESYDSDNWIFDSDDGGGYGPLAMVAQSLCVQRMNNRSAHVSGWINTPHGETDATWEALEELLPPSFAWARKENWT